MAESSQGIADAPFAKELLKKSKSNPKMDFEEAEAIATQHGEKVIGSGFTTVVVEDKKDPSKVLGFEYNSRPPAKKAKANFYRSQVMRTLFPHNIPKMFSAHGKNEQDTAPTGTVREKIVSGTDFQHTPHTIEKMRYLMDKLQLPVEIDTTGPGNIKYGPNGEEYYLDIIDKYHPTFPGDPATKPWNKELILNYMKENGFSEQQMINTAQAIDRLQKLEEPDQ